MAIRNLAESRRSFLSTIMVGSSSLVLSPRALQASDKKLQKLSFIVITDTHVGYRDQDGAANRWERMATELAREKGDLILHLGDVVDGGRESQYPIYLKSRKKIGIPVHEIPGNHDPEELFSRYVRKQIDTVVNYDWLRFLLLNNAHTDSHDGFLTEEQLDWIDKHCKQAARENKLVAICMHVPAHKNQHPDRGWYVKPKNGQTKLYEIIRKYEKQVLALMHGHFHNGLRGWNDHSPVHEICFPSALYNLNRNLEKQKALGYNPKEFRPGYTLVTIDAGNMKLTYKPLGAPASVSKMCPLQQKETSFNEGS